MMSINGLGNKLYLTKKKTMLIELGNESKLIDSATPGYNSCGCGSRRYYTKAEIDEMLAGLLDEDKINEIIDQLFLDYVEENDFVEIILNAIGDIYTQDQIDSLLSELESRIKTWVEAKGYLTDISLTINGQTIHNGDSIDIQGGGSSPDMSNYATRAWVTAQTNLAILTATENETARTENTYAKLNAFNQFKSEMESCCNDVNGMIDYLFGKITDLEEAIKEITGSTPDTGDTPTPDTGDTPSSEMVEAVYRVNSTSGTKILGKLAKTNFDYFVFEGNTYQISDYKTDSGDIYFPFPSTGEKQVSFHRKSKMIYDYAFYNTPLLRITLPNDTASINGWAFNTTLLTGITIPNSVTKIGQEALAFSIAGRETRNVEINFGSGLTSIGTYINPKSKGVQNIYFTSTTPPAYTGSSSVFYTTTRPTINIYVPSASVQAYKAAPGFTNVADRIQGV